MRTKQNWCRSFLLFVAVSVVPAVAQTARLTGSVDLDLHKVSFSRYGSYMVISQFPQGLYLRQLHISRGHVANRDVLLNNALRIEVISGGRSVPFTEHMQPTSMQLLAASGSVEILFAQPTLIRFRARGVGLRLTSSTPGNYPVQAGAGEWELHGATNYRIRSLHGSASLTAPWDGIAAVPAVFDFAPAADSLAEGYIGDYQTVWHAPHLNSYDEAAAMLRAEYSRWVARFPAVPAASLPVAEQAAYLEWSSVVAPMGNFGRPAILMSKDWMSSLWSWDNCFNAMALINIDPSLAWDQFMLPFDHQDKDGQLPDFIDQDSISYRHTKPPIHGWALRWMMQHSTAITNDRLRQVYQPLSRWTNWYLAWRDADHDGLAEYNQGDDSGWDNCTVFLAPPPVETPDLAALLVIQMDVLADIAARLGHPPDAAMWRERSERMLRHLIATFWRGDRFVALRAFDHTDTPGTSLLLYLPILLGDRLPAPIRDTLVQRLFEPGRFLTSFGLSTEELASPYYAASGYWRGPIWPPATFMLIDGLDRSGRHDLALNLRRMFLEMVSHSGFAENFDARTSAGSQMPDLDADPPQNRDPAYTWTSSIFLMLQLPPSDH